MSLSHYSMVSPQKPRKVLGRSSTALHKRDRRSPPLFYGTLEGGVVAKSVKDDELLWLRRSLIDALAHPKRVGLVCVTVQHQQRRMAARDRSNIVPLVGKGVRHPSWNAPAVNGPVAPGRKCAAHNHAGRRRTKFGVSIQQNGIAHREAEHADATVRGKARLKQYVSGDGILVEIADRARWTAVTVTGVVENN